MKTLLLLILLLTNSLAFELGKCSKCSVSKEYMKCVYYVETKGDLSRQETCLLYAHSLNEGNSEARASWFFLLAGKFDLAIVAGKKAFSVKEYYAIEQTAEGYLLKGDRENAKKNFQLLKSKIKENIFLERNFKVLARLYPDKFDIKVARELAK